MIKMVLFTVAAMFGSLSSSASAATLVATYDFNGTLSAVESTAPSLVSIDPFGQNHFETALINGISQQVFAWSGNGSNPNNNAGLSLDATNLVSYDNYSVALTFEFLSQAAYGSGWRRILDTQNRNSDNGFYVDPSNRLQVYPVVTGATTFTTPGFHDVVLSNYVVNGTREVKAYLDGKLELTSNTDQLNLNNPNNPGHLLNFFVDNIYGPAQQEFADGRIASLKIYDGVIVPSVPEPETYVMMLAGLGLMGYMARRRKNEAV
jgi:hypothetical protein